MNALAQKTAVLSILIATTAVATAGTITWSGADEIAHANTNWSDANNWTGNVLPGAGDAAYFDNAGISSSAGPAFPDNFVDINITVGALWYAETNTSPLWHNTVINSGKTLTVSNTSAEIILDSGTQTDPAAGTTQCYNTISGAGSLVVNDTNSESVMIVSQGSSSYTGNPGLWSTLDMSNLNVFTGTFGRLLVGVQGVGATAGEVTLNASGRQAGVMSLAATNVINLVQTGNIQGTGNAAAGGAALVINDAPFFGDGRSSLALGRSNAIFADTITVGRQQCNRSAIFNFNPFFTAGTSQLYLRGETSNRVSEFVVADNTVNGSTGNANPNFGTGGSSYTPSGQVLIAVPATGNVGSAGVVDLSAGSSDIMIDTLIVGKGYQAAGGGYAAGIFNLGAGTLNVNTLLLGDMSSASATAPAFGVLNVNGGTVVVNGTLAIGQTVGGGASSNAYGALNIFGGGVWANTLNNSGSASNSISVQGGSLNVTNPIAGPPITLSLDSSTANGQASVTMNFASGPVALASLTVDGNSGDHVVVNISALPPIIVFPATFTLIQATALHVTGGTFNMTAGTLPAGYTGASLTQNGNTILLTVNAGPGTGSIWTGLDAPGNPNWSDTNNWADGILPTAPSTVLFDNSGVSSLPGPGTPDNVVNSNVTASALWYAETNTTPMWHNTVINAGKTLTLSNNGPVIVFDSGTQTDPPAGNTQCYNTISGAGSLVVNDTNSESVAIVSQGSGTYTGGAGLWASLDMSNLNTFQGTFGRLLVGLQGVGATPGEATLNASGRQAGLMSLAATNVLNLTQTGNIQGAGNAAAAGPALVINDAPFFGDYRSALTLGQSNALFADTITVGRQQCSRSAFFQFNPSFSPSQLYLRGESSNRVSEFIVGDNTVNGNTGNASPNGSTTGFNIASSSQDFIAVPSGGIQVGSAGVVDLSAGASDLMIDTLILGKSYQAAGGGYAAGIFNLGTGTLNVNSLLLGVMSSASASEPAFGTLNVDGGTVIVNTQLALGQGFGGGTSTLGYGTVNINGGALWANVINNGGGPSSVNIHGGSLIITNPVGTAATLSSFAMDSSTAQSSLTINIGSGPLNVTSLESDGGAVSNVINISGMPSIFLLPTTIPVIQAAGGMTLSNGAFNFVLGALPNGYTGHLVNGGSAVDLVITTGPIQVNVWTAAGTSEKTNWSDALNWSGGVPTAAGAAFFNANASQTSSALSAQGGGPGALVSSKLNNVVDKSFTISGLIYTNLNSFENTYISNGSTLTVSTLMSVGVPSFDLGKNNTDHVTVSGPGSLGVGGSFYVGLGDTNSGSTAAATLDMSALSAFNANAGSFLIGVGGYAQGYTVPQPAGVVYLAQSNVIMATSGTPDVNDSTPVGLEVGDADTYVNGALASPALVGSAGSALYLGQSNAIYANDISVGRQLASGGIFFNPSITNSSPTTNSGPWAYVSGGSGAGTRVANWVIGDGVANPLANGGGSGTNDFTGGYVNALVNTLTVANSSSGSTLASSILGTLSINAGMINANTLNISYNNAYSDGNVYSYGVGKVNVSGTASVVVNGALNLAYAAGFHNGGTVPAATLNVTGAGASVWANAVVAGTNGATTTITVSGGSLAATNGLGTASAPLTSLNLTNATIIEGATVAPFVNAQNVSVGGSAITFNVLNLPPIEVYPIAISLMQSSTAIKGSAAYSVVLPAGFVGSAALSGDSKSVLLTLSSGTVVPRGNVYWVGPDPVSSSINWTDPTNWFLPPVPAAVDTAFFDNSAVSAAPGVGAVDNIVNSNLTIAGLWYAETNSNAIYGWHNTVINSNVTLTVANTNIGIILDTGTQTDPQLSVGPGSASCFATINSPSGLGSGGKLVVNDLNPESFMVVSQGSGTYAGGLGGSELFASLDMSGLDTFQGAFGRILIGIEGAAPVAGVPTLVGSSRQSGRLSLAATNIINLTQTGNIQGTGDAAVSGPALVLCDQGGTGGGFGDDASLMYLGESNALFIDTITIGREGSVRTAVLAFNPAPQWTGPQQLYLRGESSNRVSELVIADTTLSGTTGNSAGNGGLPSPGNNGPPPIYSVSPPPGGSSASNPSGVNPGSVGLMDVSQGVSDIMIDTLIVGKSRNSAGGGYADGVFNMGLGTLNVNTLILGNLSDPTANVPCSGTLNVPATGTPSPLAGQPTNSTVVVNNQLVLGLVPSGGSAASAFGALNINPGGVVAAASIITGSSENSAITNNGGTLSLTSAGGSIGTVAAPIGTIMLSGGTILNLAVGNFPAVVTSNLIASGSSDTINVTGLPLIAGALPQTNTLIRSISPISGYDFVLGTLPKNYTASIQMSADGTSVQLVVKTAPFPAKGVSITSAQLQTGNFVLTGTNGLANAEFVVLTSTNLAGTPRWTPIATNSFDGNGNFNLSLPYAPAVQGQYYKIESQ